MKRFNFTKIRVRLYLKSGETIVFHCNEITTETLGGDGAKLTKICCPMSWGFPWYIRLNEVVAIQLSRVISPYWS